MNKDTAEEQIVNNGPNRHWLFFTVLASPQMRYINMQDEMCVFDSTGKY